ncbi:unnamed protein product [Mesocestoides corti]|uniref:Immunoglobulin-binding protein 1 n=1 Tax=Mesocestoides corti TaxID=53468 RepID=A0A0R3U269_MESCO|nr:unnamed protein product [Mesocestoides corti]
MVNKLELFSKNETLEDLSTASIRYLTLPAFLGFFTSQKSDREDRLSNLKLAQTFYEEFLDVAESYHIPDLPARRPQLEAPAGGDQAARPQIARKDPNALREEKIRSFKEKRALEKRLGNFLALDSSNVDDEILREESLALVRYWAYTAVEELRLITEEMAIVSRFNASGVVPEKDSETSKPDARPRQPPLLITRERIRAAVFGAGYPSVPTMTLDQFVDLQVRQGLMPPPQSRGDRSVGSSDWRRVDPTDDQSLAAAEEEKAAREDALSDAHSEAQRAQARDFDAFKDEHRRGSGNRANRA